MTKYDDKQREQSQQRALVALVAVLALLLGGIASATTEPGGTDTDASSTTSPIATGAAETGVGGITTGGGGGGNVNNEVVVINTVDGRFANRAGFGTARVTGDEAENQNAAAATSSCTDCRTVAVAVQIVLIERNDASVISPRNFAIAINNQCLRCQTFAAAYQYVITTDGLVRFTPAGQQRLAELQRQIRALAATDGIEFPVLEAQIDDLVEQMWSVVDNELVMAGVPADATPYQDSDTATEDATASPSPVESGIVEASPSPEASHTGSASSETPQEPGDSPSPTPSPSTGPSPTNEPSPSSSSP